jgi:hypothetical protein
MEKAADEAARLFHFSSKSIGSEDGAFLVGPRAPDGNPEGDDKITA